MPKSDVWRGVLAGVARFAANFQDASPAMVTAEIQREVFETAWVNINGREWPPRGERLFAELLTMGILVRRLRQAKGLPAGDEAPLTNEEIRVYIDRTVRFLNCWFHTTLPG